MNRNTAQENIRVIGVKDPITITASFNSAAIDSAGYETIMGVVYYGLNGDTLDANNFLSCKLQHAILGDGSDWVDIPAALIVGSTANVFGVNNSAADDNALYSLGAKDFNRYVRIVVTLTGSMTYGTPIACFFNKFDAGHADVGNVVRGS